MALTDAGQEARIAELRRRWDADRASRVFLQLAEEYRRAGRFRDALEVLEGGLREHPNYLSARVALGRTRLEMGQAESASAVLGEVVAQDPTHMVANKLLVDARLRCGDAAGARERLDLYRLLNDGDPEIAGLEERLAALTAEKASPAPAAAAPKPAPALAAEDGPTEEAVEAAPGPAVAATPAPEPTPLAETPSPAPALTVPAVEGSAAEPEPAPPPAGPSRAGAGEPFAALVADADRRRYLAGLGEEGIFPVALPPEPPPPAVAEPAAAAEPPEVAEPEPQAPEPPAFEPLPTATAEPPAIEAGLAGLAEAFGVAKPVDAGGDGRDAGEATVTLGQLYLDQEHYAEAERAFRAVLERDPGNAAALLGLGEAERFRPRPLTADQLLRWAEGRGRADAGRPRRMVLLDAYLSRIREGGRSDVP